MNPHLCPSAKPRSGRASVVCSWRTVGRGRLLPLFGVGAMAVALCSAARGSTSDTWLGGSGNWTDKHWSVSTGSGYPNDGSPPGTTYAVAIDGGNAANSDVTLSTSVTIDSLSISTGDALDLSAGGVLTLSIASGAGSIDNAGAIKLGFTATTMVPAIRFDGTGVASPMTTLSGGGSITMAPATTVSGVTGLETLVSMGTISGTGTINNLNLINHGTINANMSGATLLLSPTSSVANAEPNLAVGGILEATVGGILGLGAGTFDNTPGFAPGTISAIGGSKVQIGLTSGATTLINGGTLSTDSASTIENHGLATLKNLSILSGARFFQADGSTTSIEGTVTNGGTMVVLSTGAAVTALNLDNGDATLAGSGSILLYGSTVAGNDPNLVKILQSTGGAPPRLTIGPGQTISGVGQFGNFSTTQSPKLTNHGGITASTLPPNIETSGITFFPLAAADALVNDGTLAANDNNAFLTLSGGTVTNYSGPSTPGTIVAHGHNLSGTLIFERGVTVSGGAILLDGPLATLQLNSAAALPDTLTNATGGTIATAGAGTASKLGGAIANSGGSTIVATAGTTLNIQPSGSGLSNSATLRAAAGAALNIVGGYSQTSGETNVLGTLNVSGGPLVASGGKLSGTGATNLNAGFNLTGSVTKQDAGIVTIAGPQQHSAGASLAINGGSVKFNVASGTMVSVAAGVSVSVAAGATLELAGSISALASSSGRAAVMNNGSSPAGILVSGTHQQVGPIDGLGATQVNSGSDLTADHVIQSALVIGGAPGHQAVVTIAPSNSASSPALAADALLLLPPITATMLDHGSLPGGTTAVSALAPLILGDGTRPTNPNSVPEPPTILLAALGIVGWLSKRRLSSR